MKIQSARVRRKKQKKWRFEWSKNQFVEFDYILFGLNSIPTSATSLEIYPLSKNVSRQATVYELYIFYRYFEFFRNKKKNIILKFF